MSGTHYLLGAGSWGVDWVAAPHTVQTAPPPCLQQYTWAGVHTVGGGVVTGCRMTSAHITQDTGTYLVDPLDVRALIERLLGPVIRQHGLSLQALLSSKHRAAWSGLHRILFWLCITSTSDYQLSHWTQRRDILSLQIKARSRGLLACFARYSHNWALAKLKIKAIKLL